MRRTFPAALGLAVLVAGGAAVSAGAATGTPVTSDVVATPADPTPTPTETSTPAGTPTASATPTPTLTSTPTPTPTPTPRPAKARTALALAVTPTRVATGKSVTLSGAAELVRSRRVVLLKGARVTLQYRVRGATRWTVIRVLTAPTGRYGFAWRYPLRTSSTLRAVLTAGAGSEGAVSPPQSVTRLAPPPRLPAPRTYANCKALDVVYPHGVGRPGAVDHTSGTPVTTFVRDVATYRLNTGRDRDRDGIACERR